MTAHTDEIRERIRLSLAAAKEYRERGEWNDCWHHLEEAHILSQPWAWSHTRVHAAMLITAWKARDAVEARGQILRLLAGGPASAVGRYPVGNTGRARVPATCPMPVPPELAEILTRAGQRTS